MTRRLLAKGHISEAYRLAKANGLSSGARFVEAEWLAGWIALCHLNEPKVARAHFDLIGKRVAYPISRARAAYWAGRAADADRDREAAAKLFHAPSRHGTTYYGQLAAARKTKTSLWARPMCNRRPPRPQPSSVTSVSARCASWARLVHAHICVHSCFHCSGIPRHQPGKS